MKKYILWIALVALVVPAIGRGLWFYRGVPDPRPKVEVPDYQALKAVPIPLQTPEEEKNIKQLGGVALLDYAHANQYQLSEIQSLKDAIKKRGGGLETVTDAFSLERKLKYASAYIVISPFTAFTADETRLVEAFVARGGRLVVFTDATRGVMSYNYNYYMPSLIVGSDANVVNPLLEPFGVMVNNDYLYDMSKNESNFRNVFFEKFGKDELTFGLKQVALYGTHSLESADGLILLRGSESTRSSIDDARDPAEGGAALSADGNVLAFGDFTFLTPPYQNAVDNSTLISNIADFTLKGKQTRSLENFPFVFDPSDVQIYPSSEVALTAEITSAIGGLQTMLNTMSASITLAEEVPSEGNTIILGTFETGDDVQKIVKPFNIAWDDGDYVTLPKIGKFERKGNGVVLFEKNKKSATLILLASAPEDLVTLINTVASGSLNGCLTQGNIGVCGAGSGGGFFGEGDMPLDLAPGGGALPTPPVGGKG